MQCDPRQDAMLLLCMSEKTLEMSSGASIQLVSKSVEMLIPFMEEVVVM